MIGDLADILFATPLPLVCPLMNNGAERAEEALGDMPGDVGEGGNGDGWDWEALVRFRLEGKRELPGERRDGRLPPPGYANTFNKVVYSIVN